MAFRIIQSKVSVWVTMAARKLASISLYTSEYYSCEDKKTGGLLCFYQVYSSTVMNLLQLCIVWCELSF